MWLLDWLYNTLFSLFSRKQRRLAFLGLDNAGKTTLSTRLATGRLVSPLPTNAPGVNEVMIGSTTCKLFDLGGHEAARLIWSEYAASADGIVFLVDAHDRERISEAQKMLNKVLAIEEVRNVPVLVLGNKIDLTNSMGEHEMAAALRISDGMHSDGAKLKLFMCSAVRQMGYGDGFTWLLNNMQ